MSNRLLATTGPGDVSPQILPDSAFEPLPQASGDAEQISRPALTYFQDAVHRLRQNKLAMASLLLIAVVTLIGVVGPFFYPADQGGVPFQNQQNPNAIDQSPTTGEKLTVVDDVTTNPDDQIDAAYDRTKPLLAPDALAAPANLHLVGVASVNGITIQWDPLPGVSGYQVFRTSVTGAAPEVLQGLADGSVERGVTLNDVANPAQHSYSDAMGLDAAESYAYTVVSYVENPETLQRSVSPKAAVVSMALTNTIKLSDALAVDPKAEVGKELAGRSHLFGTDGLGRDVLARMISGTRVDMLLALVVPTACILIGLIFGAISGLLGGKVDLIFMRIVEIVDNFPDLLVFIILQVAIGKGLFSLYVAMTAFSWAGFARIVRGEVLRMRELEYVQASRLLGAPIMRLVSRHIGPNLFGLIIISWSARIPTVIASEAFLSMLGLGLEQPTPSWGNVVIDAARRLQVNPLQFFLPASVLAFTLLAFYLLGDSLRDAFDPKLRGRS